MVPPTKSIHLQLSQDGSKLYCGWQEMMLVYLRVTDSEELRLQMQSVHLDVILKTADWKNAALLPSSIKEKHLLLARLLSLLLHYSLKLKTDAMSLLRK